MEIKTIIKIVAERIGRLIFGNTVQETLQIFDIKNGQAKGIRINLPANLKSYYKKMSEGDYEHYILDSLRSVADINGKIIWDIGSHIGYHTLVFAKSVGNNGKVVAFEPNPNNRDFLKKNVELNPDLETIINIDKLALSNTRGEAKMQISHNPLATASSGSHLSGANTPYDKEVYKNFDEITVSLETIDGFLANHPDLTPDILKIDVEGAEFEVLLGAMRLLQDNRPIMIIEVHTPDAMNKILGLFKEIKYFSRVIDETAGSLTKNLLATPL